MKEENRMMQDEMMNEEEIIGKEIEKELENTPEKNTEKSAQKEKNDQFNEPVSLFYRCR